MSYKTRVNGHQIFGNNEYYTEWADFLESEGIEVDEEGLYDGHIKNLQGMFDTIDTITRALINDRHNQVVAGELTWDGKLYTELTDLSDSMWLNDKTPILNFNIQMIKNAYCFLPYQLFEAVEDVIEECKHDEHGAVRLGYKCYKLKDGKRIHVYAS